jgi:signal transduction histidine kinase
VDSIDTDTRRLEVPASQEQETAAAGLFDPLSVARDELCTPLNAILGFSDLLAGCDQLSERHRRYAANIAASGTVLLRRINSLLDRARAANRVELL